MLLRTYLTSTWIIIHEAEALKEAFNPINFNIESLRALGILQSHYQLFGVWEDDQSHIRSPIKLSYVQTICDRE